MAKDIDSTTTIDRRSIHTSSLVATTVAFFVGVAVPCWIAFNWQWGVGLGAMCAFWGGPGFGVMVGSARISLAEEQMKEQAAVERVTTTRRTPQSQPTRLSAAAA